MIQAGARLVSSESMSDMSDFRFFSVLPLKLAMGSSSMSDGQGGIRFCAMVLVLMEGTGGAKSGEGPLSESRPRDLGRRMVDARRSFCELMKLGLPSRGAVCGVDVNGVEGVSGVLPLMRAS
jgi:hypothetical protein